MDNMSNATGAEWCSSFGEGTRNQGMFPVTEVDRFIHLLPEEKRRPLFSGSRCAKAVRTIKTNSRDQ